MTLLDNTQPTSLLSCENLYCERDDRALFERLSFSCQSGDVVQIEGPNGAGKTTLLRILSGLFPYFEGQVLWNGVDIYKDRTSFHIDLLVLGHKSSIKLSLSPLENLQYLLGLKYTVQKAEIYQALASVGLTGYELVPCHSLSAGQVRRVNLARLYLSREKVWLLDEIFTAIDKKGVAQFERLLSVKAQEGVLIIMTTHHELAIPELKKIRLG